MRNTIARIADGIGRINAAVGRLAIWCSLYIVIAEFAESDRYAGMAGAGSILARIRRRRLLNQD